MCGIFGTIGKPNDPDRNAEFLRALLLGIERRGGHATGFYGLYEASENDDDDTIAHFKLDIGANEFITLDPWIEYSKRPADVFIAHTRFRTNGTERKMINNHPHVSDDHLLAIVHNGIYSGYRRLQEEYPMKGECDSEMILRIADAGRDAGNTLEGFRDVFDKGNYGSYSVLGAEYTDDGMYLYAMTNGTSPLAAADLRPVTGQIVFASTIDILRTALEHVGIKDADIHSPDPYVITRIKADDLSIQTLEATRSNRYNLAGGSAYAWDNDWQHNWNNRLLEYDDGEDS